MDSQRLRIAVSNMKNANGREELDRIRTAVLRHLSELPAVPSAQFALAPPVQAAPELPEEEMEVRGGGQAYDDARRVRDGDESDDDAGPLHRDDTAGPPAVKAEAAAPADAGPEVAMGEAAVEPAGANGQGGGGGPGAAAAANGTPQLEEQR
jgi:histone deacetylase 1/2